MIHGVLRASLLGGRWPGEANMNLACLFVQSLAFCRCFARTSTMTGGSSTGFVRGCHITSNLLSVWGLAGTFAKYFFDYTFANVLARCNNRVFSALRCTPPICFMQTVCVVQRVLHRCAHRNKVEQLQENNLTTQH
ncbi:unnamed protein product, partial [Ectocarpus sp. 12 AP-2014]